MKKYCELFFNIRIYFPVNLLPLFFILLTVSCQNKSITEEPKFNMKDSINKVIIDKNGKTLVSLDNYVFSDTANLYKYQPNKIELNTLNGTSSRQEKIEAIKKVNIYKSKKETIKFSIKNNVIYLQGVYYDVEDRNLGLLIDLEKNIFLVDLNNDGYKEILFYPEFNGGLEGKTLVVWSYNKRKNKYYFVYSFGNTDYIEKLLVNTNNGFLRLFSYGCCSDYSDKIYEYKILENKGKLEIQLQNAYTFSAAYCLFPKKNSTPITYKLTYTSFIYSKPFIKDCIAPDIEFTPLTKIPRSVRHSYFIGEIPKGITITELATYTNSKGEKWRFVILKKGYKPDILINFEIFGEEYQIYAWLPPENYDKEGLTK
jgi:hypothetical protein